MCEPEPTVLIVGAGIFGSSTAYHLAKKYKDPSRITVLDETPFPVPLGASTDINKIIRHDYSIALYCELAHDAIQAWSNWPELRPFYHQTGWIMLDAMGSDLAQRIRKVLKEHGWDQTDNIRLDELDARCNGIFHGSDFEDFNSAYWNPIAGWCNAADATAAIMQSAVDRGVNYMTDKAYRLESTTSGVVVHTAEGQTIQADQVVLATGAWTSMLMSPLEDDLEIAEEHRFERQATAAGVCVAHYKMSDEEMAQLSDMPVVVYGSYGEVIPPPKENRLLKFTNARTFKNTIKTRSGHSISVPPAEDQRVVSSKLKEETENNMMSKIMPKYANGRAAEYWRLCWDAITPTQDWLLTRHPDARLQNLYFAVGGSFHSYKFLPNAGQYMVNVLNGQGNGTEKDKSWAWKTATADWKPAHEKTIPRRELCSLE